MLTNSKTEAFWKLLIFFQNLTIKSSLGFKLILRSLTVHAVRKWIDKVTILQKKVKKVAWDWKIEQISGLKKISARNFFYLFLMFVMTVREEHSEPCQTSKMELLAKTVNGLQSLTIVVKSVILDT